MNPTIYNFVLFYNYYQIAIDDSYYIFNNWSMKLIHLSCSKFPHLCTWTSIITGHMCWHCHPFIGLSHSQILFFPSIITTISASCVSNWSAPTISFNHSTHLLICRFSIFPHHFLLPPYHLKPLLLLQTRVLTAMAGDRTGVWVLFLLLLWLTTAIMHGDGAPVAAPAPSPDCSSALLDLADCLSFVENGSTVAKPEGQCCSGLKKVVKEDVICLCEVLKQGPSLGVNLTKALTLPSACKLSTPPFSKCNSLLSLSLSETLLLKV